MSWTESEAKKLSAVILEKIYNDLKPLNAGKSYCSVVVNFNSFYWILDLIFYVSFLTLHSCFYWRGGVYKLYSW